MLTIPEPIAIASKSEIFYLSFQQIFQIEKKPVLNRYKVCTREYIYGLESDQNREIVQFHWHPITTPDIPFPHLHLKAGAGRSIREEILKTHFRTDRWAFEDFALLLIDSFGILPERADYREVLVSNLKRFVEHRTWHFFKQ